MDTEHCKALIREVCDSLTKEEIQKATISISERIDKCIEQEGGYFENIIHYKNP